MGHLFIWTLVNVCHLPSSFLDIFGAKRVNGCPGNGPFLGVEWDGSLALMENIPNCLSRLFSF
jgi:hypothetical protein